jgi:hypothetical protein
MCHQTGEHVANELTSAAFGKFRENFPAKPCEMQFVRDKSELTQMAANDGLEFWKDGPGPPPRPKLPEIGVSPSDVRLWVVRPNDLPHALEKCSFASTLARRVIKHSNLTGGKPAHCGGELIFLDSNVIALTGFSGRYGPKSAQELNDVATAFKKSGYGVWSFGFDHDAATPFQFGAVDPEWVE